MLFQQYKVFNFLLHLLSLTFLFFKVAVNTVFKFSVDTNNLFKWYWSKIFNYLLYLNTFSLKSTIGKKLQYSVFQFNTVFKWFKVINFLQCFMFSWHCRQEIGAIQVVQIICSNNVTVKKVLYIKWWLIICERVFSPNKQDCEDSRFIHWLVYPFLPKNLSLMVGNGFLSFLLCYPQIK